LNSPANNRLNWIDGWTGWIATVRRDSVGSRARQGVSKRVVTRIVFSEEAEVDALGELEPVVRKRPAMDGLSRMSETDTLVGDGTLQERSRILDRVGRRSAGEH
jgi:hypothetical protein